VKPLRRQLSIQRFRTLRREAMPYAAAAGYLTDEDVFRDVFLKVFSRHARPSRAASPRATRAAKLLESDIHDHELLTRRRWRKSKGKHEQGEQRCRFSAVSCSVLSLQSGSNVCSRKTGCAR